MNEQFDAFERELAALKPAQPSQRLEHQIAEELQGKSRSRHAPRDVPGIGEYPPAPGWFHSARQITARATVRLTVAAGLAAAVLAAFVLRQGDRPIVADPPDPIPQPPVAMAFDDTLPTVWTYQRALSRSPGELEALLDKHASFPSPAAPTPNHLLIRADRNLSLPGEL